MPCVMKLTRPFKPNVAVCGGISSEAQPLGCLQAPSCLSPLQKSLSGHPDIGQGKQGHELGGVLGAAPIAHLVPAKSRQKPVSNKASSAPRSDSPNHGCRQSMRSIIARSNGGRPVLATGACGAMNASSSLQGMTCAILSSRICLRFRRVLRSRPRSVCFMPESLAIYLPQLGGLKASFEHSP